MNPLFFLIDKQHLRLIRSLSDNSVKQQLIRLAFALFVLLFAHTVAMTLFEGLSWGDAAWLTLTTVTTVGYGDVSANTLAGRIATVLLLYGAGIAVLAQVAALYFEFRQDRRQRILQGHWSWKMEDHIVLINSPKEAAQRYFHQLISQLRRSSLPTSKKPVLIVSTHLGPTLSDTLRALDVAHINEPMSEPAAFENSSIGKAAVVAVLCHDPNDPIWDSVNFDIVTRVREVNPNALIVAEAVLDKNREHLIKAGANHVVRPIRSYPEMLVRTLLAPGTEQVIEDLFDSDGEECVRYPVVTRGVWADIAIAMIKADIGIPLGYADASGKVFTNPEPTAVVNTSAIYAIVREGNNKSPTEVQDVLNTEQAQ